MRPKPLSQDLRVSAGTRCPASSLVLKRKVLVTALASLDRSHPPTATTVRGSSSRAKIDPSGRDCGSVHACSVTWGRLSSAPLLRRTPSSDLDPCESRSCQSCARTTSVGDHSGHLSTFGGEVEGESCHSCNQVLVAVHAGAISHFLVLHGRHCGKITRVIF